MACALCVPESPKLPYHVNLFEQIVHAFRESQGFFLTSLPFTL